MSLNILGINTSHNASIAHYNNKLISYFEEDRFNKIKNWIPVDLNNCNYKSIDQKIKFKPDIVIYTSYDRSIRNYYGRLNLITDNLIIEKIQKQLNNPKYFFNPDFHHIYHAICGFYFSKFEEAICIVMDGGGSQSLSVGYQEMDSIYLINKNHIDLKYQKHSNIRYIVAPKNIPIGNSKIEFKDKINNVDVVYNSKPNPAYKFGCLSEKIFKDPWCPGKVMGLAAYIKNTNKLNKTHVRQANKLQKESFDYTVDLINKAKKYSNIKNIVLSGGYFLNCLNNFKYVKKFKNLNFFIDPVAHDGGTAIGACIYYNDYYRHK
jgi:carbamoyltransferase